MKNIFYLFLLFFCNIFHSLSYDYLTNSNLEYNVSQMKIDFWMDDPLTGYHNSYPPSGINCIVGQEDSEIIYLITSQSLLNRWSTYESCHEQKRTVSVIKRNLSSSKKL